MFATRRKSKSKFLVLLVFGIFVTLVIFEVKWTEVD